jgi:hypothetical protein
MITIVISVILGLIVNECSDISPWCARKLVRWSAYRRYTDPCRADKRAEELAALIDNRPGKILKLFSALGFAGSAICVACRRGLTKCLDPETAREQMLEQARPRAEALARTLTWSGLFPGGRRIYYEGDDPEGFVRQIRNEFGFDPALDPDWELRIEGDDDYPSYSFHCPAGLLDDIYGDHRFPMGS